MKVKKIGHCCLLIEVDGLRIMTDPGSFSIGQAQEPNINFVLITHEHGDHLHIESLKQILAHNPNCKVITNSGVKKVLDGENIPSEILEDGKLGLSPTVNISAKTCAHADIFEDVIPVKNTGYMIADRLFYPGDAFLNPERTVEILALPVVAPWCKISEVLEYALLVKPKKAFPVHDGLLNNNGIPVIHGLCSRILTGKDIDFKVLKEGATIEF